MTPKFSVGNKIWYQDKRYLITITGIHGTSYYYTYNDTLDSARKESMEINYDIEKFEAMDEIQLSLKHTLNEL